MRGVPGVPDAAAEGGGGMRLDRLSEAEINDVVAMVRETFPHNPTTPERREELLAAVAKLWASRPHWRFGQLVDNVMAIGCRSANVLFYVTDGDIIDAIERMDPGSPAGDDVPR